MTKVKRVLFISNLYPNPLSPNMATFNRQQIGALREYCEVEVIAPIPWTALLRKRLTHRTREENSVFVHHPSYYYIPYIFRNFYGEFFYLSIKKISDSLLEKQRFDLIYSSWLYPDSWAAARLAKRYKLPLYVKVHGSDVNRLIPGTSITNSSMEVASQAEKLICVSNALKEKLIALGVPGHKIQVNYNGVDSSLFYPMNSQNIRQQLDIAPDEYLILYVGNVKKEKGLYELVAAFSIASETFNKQSRLVIIGTGPYRVKLEQLVSSLHLSEKVLFLGSQNLEVIALWMNGASVLCLTSYMEGVPNVILEALACGTYIIATEVGGVPELDTGDGRMTLVPKKNVGSLVAALQMSVTKQKLEGPPSFLCSWNQNAKQLMQIFSYE